MGLLWTLVIALDFFWLSNPLVFWTFTDSMRNACAVTLVAALLTPMRRVPQLPWSILAILAFGFLTMLWSTFAHLTMHFALLYLAIAVIGLGIAATVDARTVAHGMLLGGVLVVIGSIYAFKAGLPGSAPAPGEGYLAGVGTNRNILSYTLILALPFALSFMPRSWAGRALWLAGIGTLLSGIYLTQAATGFVAAVFILGMAVVMGWRDWVAARAKGRASRVAQALRFAPMIVFVTGVAVLVVIIQIRHRDAGMPTLTGRTTIWASTWDAVGGWDRWVGSGWGAVWQHPWLPAGVNKIHTEIVERAGVFTTHGHNSFFDLLPEIGLLGSLLFAMSYLQAGSRALSARRLATHPTGRELEASRMVLLALIALLTYGFTEPMSTIPLGWWVLVTLTVGLSPEARRAPAIHPGHDWPSSEVAGDGQRELDRATSKLSTGRVPNHAHGAPRAAREP